MGGRTTAGKTMMGAMRYHIKCLSEIQMHLPYVSPTLLVHGGLQEQPDKSRYCEACYFLPCRHTTQCTINSHSIAKPKSGYMDRGGVFSPMNTLTLMVRTYTLILWKFQTANAGVGKCAKYIKIRLALNGKCASLLYYHIIYYIRPLYYIPQVAYMYL